MGTVMHAGRLLYLPFELSEMIWGFAASTGDANGLLRCCRQTRDEFSPYCQLPDNVNELHRLKILVDSTYDHGIWLKFDYHWKQDRHIRHAVSAIQDMSDPMALRLGRMSNIGDIVVILRAPRRGYCRSRFRKDKGWPSDAQITIRFATEGVQSSQSTREAKSFWECRATKILEDPLRKHITDRAQMPYFYEYFLIAFFKLPSVPTILHDKAVQSHGHRGYHVPARNTMSGCLRKEFRETLLNFQKNIAAYAARMLVEEDIDIWDPPLSRNREPPDQLAWKHINYHRRSIKARYQFLLDNLVGTVGGCMDMLRLHRFKTMLSSRLNYFSRHEWVAGRDSGGLAGASSKINWRLRALFDPDAADEVLRLRRTCSHLRAVPWATASSDIPFESRSSSLWLEHYPNGIRYHWSGRNLVEWNFRWEAKKHQIRSGIYYREDRVARLSRWWECLGCCQGSLHCMSEVASPCDRKRLRNTYAFIQDYDSHDPYDQLQSGDIRIGRPVIISRECIRKLKLKKGRYWGKDWCTYRNQASEYTIWNIKSRSKETTAERKKSRLVCYEYSVKALCNERVDP
ncbi:hypothetical protein FPCIR_9310 [Fusarium pseudocircinatum]|uniref:Uncharacterized protein n=1 Tax=Fusarium pseudocircinatum TaxID=56676 RepID=A0A8H5L127_9HYPO|nr:hypothetical protein FPCIR_9310 [Fusarium pseudocircinatum]